MVHPAGRPPGAAGVAAVAVVDVDAAATPVAAGVSAALPPAETKFIKPPRLGGPPPPSEPAPRPRFDETPSALVFAFSAYAF